MRYYGLTSAKARSAIETGATLVREPNNPHDKNAIAVMASGKKLGHIDKRNAARLAPFIDAGFSYRLSFGEKNLKSKQAIPVTVTIDLPEPQIDVPKVCKPNVIGIYAIDVKREKKSYIGQSLDVQGRIAHHWRELAVGVHLNPELQRYWQEWGPGGFSARVLESAPSNLHDLDLTKWLVEHERSWIAEHGGLSRVINAEWPAPVFHGLAGEQLEKERQKADGELTILQDNVRRFESDIQGLYARWKAMSDGAEAVRKWWGLFASSDERTQARLAEAEGPALLQELDQHRARLENARADLAAKKASLFID